MTGRFISLLLSCFAAQTAIIRAAAPIEQQMADKVDAALAQAWADNNIVPAPASSDAEFLRRVTLDLTGILPNINQVREFLADVRPDKRPRLIDRLLDATKTPRQATHLANIWRGVMLPTDTNVARFGGDRGFSTWWREQFSENVPYDKMVKDLLQASGDANQTGPDLFYTALQLKPEDVAASTSRIFLGTQIQCAQCHNHPFDHWTQKRLLELHGVLCQITASATRQRISSCRGYDRRSETSRN